MLDIRATSFVSPVSEVTFESVPLTVHIVNVADETGLVTGKFRVYNDTTGLLIHTSDIAPLTLAAGAGIDASALTDFDPPAPADAVYFVIFDGHASNALVPDGISFALGAFYFDVKPVGMGPAPAAHHATHEDGGSDEIDVADLSGVLADPQTPAAHATSHENGGSDEVDVTNLSGELSDRQRAKLPIAPDADSTTAVQITKADGATAIVNVDSTNKRVGINKTNPASDLDVPGKTILGDGTQKACLLINGGGPSVTSIDMFVICAVGYPYMQFVNNASGGAVTDGFKLGIEGQAGAIATNEDWPIDFYTNGGFRFRIAADGKLGININSPTALLDVNSDIIRLRTSKTPASAGAAGNAGDICWDADYIYVCTATNTWKRVAIATW